jgi:hypothetical protein
MISSMVAVDLKIHRGSNFLRLQATMLDVGRSVASCVDLSSVSLGTVLTYKKSCICKGFSIYKINTCHPRKTLNLEISTQTLLGILWAIHASCTLVAYILRRACTTKRNQSIYQALCPRVL